jgi:hypothetical protein
MFILAGILLTLAACWLVLAPLLSGRAAPLTDGPDRLAEIREVRALRDVAYEALRDIEFDYHAGKISEADYRELGDRYREEAIALVRRLDALAAAEPGRRTEPARDAS